MSVFLVGVKKMKNKMEQTANKYMTIQGLF
jgi:hypothetical protein